MNLTYPSRFPGAATLSLVGRHLRGAHDIDEWGLDPELIAMSEPVIGARWEIHVSGADQLPATGGAVLVFNRRVGMSEPWVVARGIRQATGRFVRTVGVADVAPVGPLLRRFGAVVDRPDELRGLLRAGQLIGLPAGRSLRDAGRVGAIEHPGIEAAVAAGAPLVPVAMVGREVGRQWRVVVGAPIPTAGRGAPSADQAAVAVHDGVQALLDDATPASWWY